MIGNLLPLVLVASMVFGLWALEALIAYFRVPPPDKGNRLLVFIYCLIMALILLAISGYVGDVGGHGALFNKS